MRSFINFISNYGPLLADLTDDLVYLSLNLTKKLAIIISHFGNGLT